MGGSRPPRPPVLGELPPPKPLAFSWGLGSGSEDSAPIPFQNATSAIHGGSVGVPDVSTHFFICLFGDLVSGP